MSSPYGPRLPWACFHNIADNTDDELFGLLLRDMLVTTEKFQVAA